jgi:hypothetical protein
MEHTKPRKNAGSGLSLSRRLNGETICDSGETMPKKRPRPWADGLVDRGARDLSKRAVTI